MRVAENLNWIDRISRKEDVGKLKDEERSKWRRQRLLSRGTLEEWAKRKKEFGEGLDKEKLKMFKKNKKTLRSPNGKTVRRDKKKGKEEDIRGKKSVERRDW